MRFPLRDRGRAVITTAAGSALVWSAAQARRRTVGRNEERVFRLVNDRTDRVAAPVWLVMQAGSLLAVFVAALSAHRLRTRRGAGPVLIGGTALWAGVKLAKLPVGRGRPWQLLDNVHVRGAPPSGLGYPSGHSAVSTTLALLLTRPGAGRRRALSIACATGTARMYVGAHLPLDVVGGIAIGTLAANAIDALTDTLVERLSLR